ncbi:MAG: tetratricopeptide repeat protein, partial [Myxococcales bacterium]|nr:tetratricopeptide repeat protein [Myxococcales bacterium]
MRTARLRTSTHISLRALQAGVIAAAALLGGCGSRQTVARVYDGELRLGRAVGSEAYSAFLAGTLADAAGDSQRALAAYERALRLDDDAPEIWTRLGDLRCRLDPKDQVADRAFGRALDLDPTYAGAHAARSRCDLASGRDDEAAASARAELAADPRA